MIVTKDQICKYIPHRDPFVMVDNLLVSTNELIESDFHILENNLLVDQGYFQEGGLMENIAQTCAVGFGVHQVEDGAAPKMGFIGAITKMHVHELPPVGAQIKTVVVPITQLGNISLVKGMNYFEERMLLECEMKIVIN